MNLRLTWGFVIRPRPGPLRAEGTSSKTIDSVKIFNIVV